ncbi:MAG TPA: cytochrome c biogenesis protein CcsA [Candidatus Binatia bacterium]|jgi:heme exporter protein C|nr:cytochrome c biogenesis protein CcsA [Candidatus Binatia bacterium]
MRKFEPFADNLLPWLTCLMMIAALAMVFLYVPNEQVQGVPQRIFYFHLPAAWNTFLGFFIVAGASAAYLWQGDRFSDLLAQAAAEIGMVFCTVVIITGSLWARPIWGVWWTWDPRLTMVAILWMIYAAYVLLRVLAGDNELIARYAAVLGIVGVLDIPILYIAVRLWRGIHPKVERMAPEMAWTLLVCTGAFLCLFAWLLWLRLRSLQLQDEVAALRREALAAS